MSTILGNPITLGGGGGSSGAALNIDFGTTPPSDTSKLWVPLASKPDAVECSPVIQYGSEYLTTLENGAKSLTNVASAVIGSKIYSFSMQSVSSMSTLNEYFHVYDIETRELTHIELTSISYGSGGNVRECYGSTPVAYENSIYLIGGVIRLNDGSSTSYVRNGIFKFTPDTNTFEQVATLASYINTSDEDGLYTPCACVYDNTIYIFGGGLKGYSNKTNVIQTFEINSRVTNTLSTTLPYYLSESRACRIGDSIYIFGGKGGSSSTSTASTKYVIKYEVTNDSITSEALLPNSLYCVNPISYGQYAYLFGGNDANTIIRFDSLTNTVETLSYTLPVKGGCAAGLYNNVVYIYGIYYKSNMIGGGSFLSYVSLFTINTPLSHGNLFLQEDIGYSGLWNAINDNNFVLKAKIINAYLGDSNNIAQLTDAYLYDSDSATWKSLDGVSMTADMLAALATLGVT